MSIIDLIKRDQLVARKSKDTVRIGILTCLLGELGTKQINAQKDLTDIEVFATIKKFINGVMETIALRPSDDLDRELNILESYLPVMLSDQELNDHIDVIIATVENPNGKSLGIVIKELKAKFDGLYDGKHATNLIRSKLGN